MRLDKRISLIFLLLTISAISQQTATPSKPLFKLQEVMIPVRDGVRLQTAILTPVDQQGPLPILFRRTPYGVPEKPPEQIPSSMKELAQDGYIFVIQNLRGRFKSEGTFFNLSSAVDLKRVPKATNETTDAYDTIDWLVKHVANNNGKVGMYGVSYDGLTTALTLLMPHPALKAISEQASPADQWMNDDDHRYGALRESYCVRVRRVRAGRQVQEHALRLRHLRHLRVVPEARVRSRTSTRSTCTARFPLERDRRRIPNYDAFGQTRGVGDTQIKGSTVPNLNVAGFWDQEDPWGPWQIFRHAEESDPDHTNFMVAGPWFHGSMADAEGRQHRPHPVRRARDGARVPREHRGAVLPLLSARQGREARWQATTVPDADRTRGRRTTRGRPKGATPTNLYLHSDGTLSFDSPRRPARRTASTCRIRPSPVPYRQRPISPTYPDGDWRTLGGRGSAIRRQAGRTC